jgi:hypothetical protein
MHNGRMDNGQADETQIAGAADWREQVIAEHAGEEITEGVIAGPGGCLVVEEESKVLREARRAVRRREGAHARDPPRP